MGEDERSGAATNSVNIRDVADADFASPAFLADRMFGKLARWLRIMGYDTEYAEDVDDTAIARLAVDEGRILLTRDRGLHSRKGIRSIYIAPVELEEQLRFVATACNLSFDESRMRCSLCNGAISAVSPEAVSGDVDSAILLRHSSFYRCSKCGKVYWRGSHWERISKTIIRAVAERR
jgi:hypothetical protein